MPELPIQTQAFALKHALCMGAVSVNTVVSWADDVYRSSTDVADWLATIALSKTPDQAISALSAVPTGVCSEDSWPWLKQLIAKALATQQTSPQAVAGYCYNLALNGDVPAYDCEALYQFELEYDCVFAGFASQQEVDKQVITFFNRATVA